MKSRLWKWVGVLLVVELALGAGLWLLRKPRAQGLVENVEGAALPVLFPVTDFSLLNQDQATVTPAMLKGHVWIADFIFTRCTSACPILTARMVLLQHALRAANLRFVSISVDPVNDTAAALSGYAHRWNAQETRWHLLQTSPATLKAVAAGMKVAVLPGEDAENPILHDAHFQLVDAQGRVRGLYDVADPEAVKTLERDARRLLAETGAGASPGTAEGDGHALYASLGCAGCHASKLAPPLEGVFGRRTQLTTGGKVVADAAYLRRALLEPGAEVVQGYPNVMPGYRSALDDTKVDLLVAYLTSLQAAPGTAPEPARAAVVETVDPVCGMKISATAENPHVLHDGKTVYFCSDSCRDRFVAGATGGARSAPSSR